MKRTPSKAAALLTLAITASSASAAVVSWNYDNNGTVTGTAVAGVVPVANWNNSWPSNPTDNLIDDSGAATTIDISYSSFNNYRIQSTQPGVDGDGTYNKKLLNGYLNSGSSQTPTTSTINLAQIPYGSYAIYVYFSSDVANRAGSVSVGSSTYYFDTIGSASISGSNALFVQTTDTTDDADDINANYAVFDNLSGSTQSITTNIPQFGGIAGFQVVQIPEPSAALLGGLGMLALLRRRRA